MAFVRTKKTATSLHPHYSGRHSVQTGLIAVAKCVNFTGIFSPNKTQYTYIQLRLFSGILLVDLNLLFIVVVQGPSFLWAFLWALVMFTIQVPLS